MIRRLIALAATALVPLPAGAFSPALPTDNDALLRGKPQDFHMYVDRDFEGKKTSPWEGGTYGFSRGPERLGSGVVLTAFHEGIDIAPLRRDRAGEPLDEVRAIESGRVVHTSAASRDSNYGKYVVVAHDVAGAPVYSIYAHLAAIDVSAGQAVAKGARLGRLGYTGAGIDRRRAHLHLEIAILWNDAYQGWHDAWFTEPNKHGIYNGLNLMGLDAGAFYLARQRDPSLTLPRFIAGLEPAFRVQIPDSPHFQLPRRYPWLVRDGVSGARSWLVSFTAAGFPVSIEPSPATLDAPRLVWAKPSKVPYAKVTRSLLAGPPGRPSLGSSSEKLLQLLNWDPAAAPPPRAGS